MGLFVRNDVAWGEDLLGSSITDRVSSDSKVKVLLPNPIDSGCEVDNRQGTDGLSLRTTSHALAQPAHPKGSRRFNTLSNVFECIKSSRSTLEFTGPIQQITLDTLLPNRSEIDINKRTNVLKLV